MVGLESSTVDHVKDTSRGSDDDVGPLVELGNVLSDGGSSNTGVAVNVEVVSEGDDDLLDLLGELSGGSNDEGLGLLDRGVDLKGQQSSASHLTLWRMAMENVAVFPVPD